MELNKTILKKFLNGNTFCRTLVALSLLAVITSCHTSKNSFKQPDLTSADLNSDVAVARSFEENKALLKRYKQSEQVQRATKVLYKNKLYSLKQFKAKIGFGI